MSKSGVFEVDRARVDRANVIADDFLASLDSFAADELTEVAAITLILSRSAVRIAERRGHKISAARAIAEIAQGAMLTAADARNWKGGK